jgi:hypothetical protein
LFRLHVEDRTLRGHHPIRAVKTDISYQQDVSGLRVIFRIVAEDAVFSVMDLNVVLGDGDPLFKPGISIRSDFHWRIPKVPKLCTNAWQQGQQAKTKKELPHETAKLNIPTRDIKGGFTARSIKTNPLKCGAKYATHGEIDFFSPRIRWDF